MTKYTGNSFTKKNKKNKHQQPSVVNGTIEYINNVNIAFNSTVVRKSNHFNFLHFDKKIFFFASQLNGFFILISRKK